MYCFSTYEKFLQEENWKLADWFSWSEYRLAMAFACVGIPHICRLVLAPVLLRTSDKESNPLDDLSGVCRR